MKVHILTLIHDHELYIFASRERSDMLSQLRRELIAQRDGRSSANEPSVWRMTDQELIAELGDLYDVAASLDYRTV
jgi:hypothetical protein